MVSNILIKNIIRLLNMLKSINFFTSDLQNHRIFVIKIMIVLDFTNIKIQSIFQVIMPAKNIRQQKMCMTTECVHDYRTVHPHPPNL